MKRLTLLSLAVATCFCLMLATERRAYGYVDPGSGLLALQSFFAALTAGGYFLRRRIKALFSREKSTATQKTIVMPAVSARKAETRNVA